MRTPTIFLLTVFFLGVITGCTSSTNPPSTPITEPDLTESPVLDTENPTVSFISPVNGAKNVTINSSISVDFSEDMDPLTITTDSFSLYLRGAQVGTVLSRSGTTAKLVPVSLLEGLVTYTTTITTEVTDVAGNPLSAEYSWDFTTVVEEDNTPPKITSTNPGNLAIEVPPNSAISVTFSEVIDATSIDDTIFTLALTGSTILVPGTVSSSGAIATFKPSGPLDLSSSYTATVKAGVSDLAQNSIITDNVWTFTTAEIQDTSPPRVIYRTPIPNSPNNSTSTSATATFSEPMDPTTINTATFLLTDISIGTAVRGTVSYTGNIATFLPNLKLGYDKTYRATVTQKVSDSSGNFLLQNDSWQFTVESEVLDLISPTITSTVPMDSTRNVLLSANIVVNFDEAMDPLTVIDGTITLVSDTGFSIGGSLLYSGLTATFTPFNGLIDNTVYTATVSQSITDLAGNSLAPGIAPNPWSFSTRDTIQPIIVSVYPDNGTIPSGDGAASVTFNESMRSTTITTDTFTLDVTVSCSQIAPGQGRVTVPLGPVVGEVTYDEDSLTAEFRPDDGFVSGCEYEARIAEDLVTDLDGNLLAPSNINPWSFTAN